MKKSMMVLVLSVVVGGVSFAADYTCPSPDQVRCIPAESEIGPWKANGGQMTGNTFAPNNQCANVLQLSANESRLFCCYTKCGVFIQDVQHKVCRKSDQSHFSCR